MSEGEVDELWSQFVAVRAEVRSDDLSPKGESLRNKLIEHYLPLVKVTAERLYAKLPNQVDLDELKQAGVFGLMDAIMGFDPARGVKFEAYGKQRIHGAILDELRHMDFAPRLVRTHAQQLKSAQRELELELGHPPTPKEVADRLGLTLDEYDEWIRQTSMATMGSLDSVTNEGDSEGNKQLTRADSLEDRRHASPLTMLEKKELVALATKGLSRKEKLIVILYYLEELTMKEIGIVLELSESRVCQIHHRIVAQLQKQLDTLRGDLLAD
ncbi:MAG: FliA/WhiG family RNA polymerase sigma factor [Planctomycetaceae bacterium]|nr:FliA/WhiG family RNA polymerase sigma factor [Planctomycetaceae bacterium]